MTAYPLGVEIACDGPNVCRECPESAAVRRQVTSRTAVEVREDGREQGWAHTRRAGHRVDLCPNCRTGAAR